jgi:hypothetical protein
MLHVTVCMHVCLLASQGQGSAQSFKSAQVAPGHPQTHEKPYEQLYMQLLVVIDALGVVLAASDV